MKIDKQNLKEWLSDSFKLYASSSLSSKLTVRLYVNFKLEFKVTHNSTLIYIGYDIDEAVKTFNSLIK